MKILMVSIPSLHFFRWTNQLKDAGHDVYWFDITGTSRPVPKIDWVAQKTGWKLKFDYPGRSFLKKKFPGLYNFFQKYNENDTAEVFEKYLKDVKPDAVHSFALYVACTPILSVMEKYPGQKWIYSSWGSDLFYFQNDPDHLRNIKSVLPRVDYLFTDCKRDFHLAEKYGFHGRFLGVFPGGGGFDLSEIKSFRLPKKERKTILIKGFQGRSGRAISVLKAIMRLQKELQQFTIIVFGADHEVMAYCNKSGLQHQPNFKILGKLPHKQVLELMGQALLYIGNSNSDGMPNTMLEAVCAGAFPIQSNPGGATAEIINDGSNGILIRDCENVEHIKECITKGMELMYEYAPSEELTSALSHETIMREVAQIYKSIEND